MSDSNEPAPRPWWKSGWLAGLLLVGVLHATGMAVHVQAALQRVVLATGLLKPHLTPPGERPPAPLSFTVADAGGSALDVATLRGEVLFVNVWATWCAPCLAEMPAIAALHEDMGDEVRFLMISVDEDFGQAVRWFESKGYGMTPLQPASRLPGWLQTGTIPTTVVVDRSGRIAVREAGMALYDSARFRAQLRGLLSETASGR